jgi:signal transduction histidine kinase
VAAEAHRARVTLRQLVLFVLSMVVPSIVLLTLGVRIIVQQEELTEKHLLDQQRLRANEFERALSSRLARIALDHDDPALVFTAALSGGRLVLPWETPPRGDLAGSAAFGDAVMRAEREEFAAGRLDVAASRLDTALTLAGSGQQRAYMHLLRARVFAKASRHPEADRDYRFLLAVPLSAVDQDGMPFALYAAERLLATTRATDADRTAIARVIDAAADGRTTLPPAAWYLLRGVHDRLDTSGGVEADARRRRLAARISDVEQALALQRNLSSMLTQWKTSENAWLPHGDPLWLVGQSTMPGNAGPGVIVVRAGAVTAAGPEPTAEGAALSGAHLVSGSDEGEWLGARFPGMKVSVPPVESSRAQLYLQRAFYVSVLTIVLSMTMFGGYLLWRDVDREMRIAALRSQFVSSVSHELKTPLTAIRMFAETLQLDRVDARTRVEYLDTIVNETERLTRLLNNVLDFSKIEEGRKAYRREATSLAAVVRIAARAMAYPLEQHGFDLRVDVDDSLPPVDVDADALEQAILNLLTNAMKYSGNGRAIELRLEREASHAVISVRDEGIGIPLADQARIFEKFYRISTPENQRIPGTGLGLTLVEHIVKAHDGSIRVDSAPGRGSVFSILLPLGADEPRPLAIEAAS